MKKLFLGGALALSICIPAMANVFDNAASQIHDGMSETEVRSIVRRPPTKIGNNQALCDAGRFSGIKFECIFWDYIAKNPVDGYDDEMVVFFIRADGGEFTVLGEPDLR
ncbi:MAG: hypothetical protein FWD08_06225 [Alphaproteobacteria bacterium]|nr:hypothetical protein [Alphaproteobacteria bacterium]